ncbi:MAG: hypothetical protein QNJ97_03295 [Myxococcota bacterium]|nr:hypothetical protein [Myxococcota bacterium]
MRDRSLKEVQELLGHSTIQMTMRYSHLAPGVKTEAVAALDEPSRGTFGKSRNGGTEKSSLNVQKP